MPAIITNTQYGLGNLNADIADMRVRLGILPVGSTPGGMPPNKILLYPTNGNPVVIYEPTEAGLTSALAAAVSGDTVWLPSITITLTTTLAVPASVAMIGLSYGAILSMTVAGTVVSLGAGSEFTNLTINQTINSASDAIGIQAPSSGTGYVLGTRITITQNGAGYAFGVKRGNGVLKVEKSNILAAVASGTNAYAADARTGSGSLYFDDTPCMGAVIYGPFLV